MAVELIAKPHPLRSDTYICQVEPGTTLASVLEDAPETVYAQVNGKPWPRDLWDTPLPEGHVVVYAVPHGDDALRAVAMIAVAIAAAYTGGAALAAAQAAGWSTAAATAASVAASTAVTVAGTLAVNALIPPTLPETPESTSSTVRKSITGTRNQANPYGVVPRVYGAPRWYPPLAANPVTEVQGNDQYLRMLLCLGYGPLEVAGHRVGAGYPLLTHVEDVGDAIRIGETNIAQYDDVEWEIGSPEQITLYTQDIVEEPVSAALDLQDRTTGGGRLDSTDNVSAVRTTAPNTREISVDVTWPSGLYTVDSKGDAFNVDVRMRIEYRPLGGDWRTHFNGTVSAKRKETLRRSWRWTVLEGQYEVRVTRVSTYSRNREAHITDAVWTALRSVQGNSRPYTGQHVVMALRIRANDQLNGVLDQLNIKTQAVLRTWDGAAFYEQATSNPAWAYLDALTGKQVTRPVKDARVDLDAIRELADWCDAQGLAYHWVHDGPETVLERARAILAAGQASFALQDGRYSMVRDDPEAPVLQVITPRNASGFESSRQYRSLPHALRVKYIDPATWTDAERIVYREGFDAGNATIFEDLQLQGVASAEEAYHHGQYHFRQAILRPETYSVTLDWENLVLLRGNRARLAYDTIMVGLGWGRVKYIEPDEAGNAQRLILDEQLVMDPAKTYGVRIRRQDGTQATVRVESDAAGYTDTLSLAEPVEGVEPGDLVLYGEHGLESIDCKVTKIEPGADLSATLTLVDAAPDIYDYDAAPSFDPGITRPVPITQIPPATPRIVALTSSGATLVMRDNGTFAPGMRVVWAPGSGRLSTDQVEVRWSSDNGETWDRYLESARANTLRIDAPLPGERLAVQVRVRSIYGIWSAWSGAEYITPVGAEGRPENVTGFTLAAVGDTARMTWNLARDIDVLHGGHVQIYHAASTSATLSAAVPIARFAGSATEGSVPLMAGTYFAVFVDAGKRQSATPARTTTTAPRIQRLNVVETVREAGAFAGTLSDTVAIDGVLKLNASSRVDEMAEPIDAWGSIDALGGIIERGEYHLPAPIDLGAVYTARLTAALTTRTYVASDLIDVRGDVDEWVDVDGLTNITGPAAQLYVRVTNDDPSNVPAWSDWQPFAVGDYTARAFDFRLALTTDTPDHQIELSEYAITLDMPDRVEAGSNLAIPAAGRAIRYGAPFWATPALGITAEDLGPGERVNVTQKTEEGFTVQILDASGNGVARTIDYIAKGYGYQEAAHAA